MGQKDFKGHIDKRRAYLEKAIARYFNRCGSQYDIVFKAMKHALFSGGKRIRPVLCLEACYACGGDIKKAIPPACAIEFIHNFSLVHDDLPSIDNDDYRREKPTCHKRFGEAIAILAGDALLAFAFEILSDIKDKDVLQRLLKTVARSIGLSGMIGGQGFDIIYRNRKKSGTLWSKINTLKTAKFFSAATKSGAISAGVSHKKIKRMELYGLYFGKAFQIRDDIYDG